MTILHYLVYEKIYRLKDGSEEIDEDIEYISECFTKAEAFARFNDLTASGVRRIRIDEVRKLPDGKIVNARIR